jgi:glucose/mannose transport system substrate-binding protein
MDMSLDAFDPCAKASRRDFDATLRASTLLPSVSIDMAIPAAPESALRAVVSEFWSNDATSVDEALGKFVLAGSAKQK